jgi:hypothetical protein
VTLLAVELQQVETQKIRVTGYSYCLQQLFQIMVGFCCQSDPAGR